MWNELPQFHPNYLIFTTRVRNTTGGYVFPGVCLFSGGLPQPLVPGPFWGGGRDTGIPSLSQDQDRGTPPPRPGMPWTRYGTGSMPLPFSCRRTFLIPTVYIVRWEGYVLTHVCPSVCPHPGGGGVYPCRGGTPSWVTPPPRQTWPGGYPTLGTPPRLNLAEGGYPTSGNRWSTWHAAVGMPLAFTQEDFLVTLIFSLICDETSTNQLTNFLGYIRFALINCFKHVFWNLKSPFRIFASARYYANVTFGDTYLAGVAQTCNYGVSRSHHPGDLYRSRYIEPCGCTDEKPFLVQ